MGKAGTIIGMACLMLAMSMAVPASENRQDFKEIGVSIAFPEEFNEMEGLLVPYPLGAIDAGHHVYAMLFLYEAMSKKEAVSVLSSSEVSEEIKQAFYDAQGIASVLIASEAGFDTAREEYDREMAEAAPLNYDQAEEAGSAEGFTFYLIPAKTGEEYISSIEEKYAREFQNLNQVLLEALKGAEFYKPEDSAKEMTGRKIEFTTTDLDGNTVTSEELFSENEITMINCWGVWCPNCIVEMEELAQIHKRMQEKGCGILGLEWERTPTEETYQTAREMMEEWGTGYPNVLMPDELLNQVNAFPTSIFVDREGVVLGMPIVGASVSAYEPALDALLEGADAQEETEPAAAEGIIAVYSVNVTDEDGPVEGVSVQFCDDTTCRFGETDEDGTAVFEVPGGKEYEIHVVEVPDGYEEDETVYHTVNNSGEVNIRLVKEG